MKKITFYIFVIAVTIGLRGQEILKPYEIFDHESKTISFEKMADSLANFDVVFFGELHNNPIAHWLQLELTKKLTELKNNEIVLGAEMFERDSQLLIDEYFSNLVNEKTFIEDTNAWDNYKTDYAPLVNFAKDNLIPFIATNVPRRYANLVSKKGLDSLELLPKETRKKYIAPLPIEVPYGNPSYTEMEKMMSDHGMKGSAKNFIDAQALKDATMAHSIVSSLKGENKSKLFLHYNGNFHSKNHEGTAWYVQKHKKRLKIAVISFVLQENVSSLETINKGNNEFIIVCKNTMTNTF